MKLARYGEAGREKPAMMDAAGNLRCVADLVPDWTGATLDQAEACSRADLSARPLVDAGARIGPCVGAVGKFVCIGLNYADHAAETGAPIPEEPVIFLKATSAISGPNDPIIQPRGSTKLDWEVELGVVIGKPCRYVTQAEATEHIAGYTVINDVSERAFQMDRGGTWDKGKGCDSFGPLGPWLVTRDEVCTDDLHMWLKVNGRQYQNGSTRTMIFKPDFLVSYVSQFMTLYPGDVISTGTPPGVGLGQKPPIFLVPGDVVELGIEGLGSQRQTVITPI